MIIQKTKERKKESTISPVNNKDTRRKSLRRSGFFMVNFEQMSHFILMFLLLTWNK